jgi:hypothetical protein
MFTPRGLSVGDHVFIDKDLSNEEGTFGAGHEFTIIDIHFRGDAVLYDLRDNDLHLLGDVPLTDLVQEQDDTSGA